MRGVNNKTKNSEMATAWISDVHSSSGRGSDKRKHKDSNKLVNHVTCSRGSTLDPSINDCAWSPGKEAI